MKMNGEFGFKVCLILIENIVAKPNRMWCKVCASSGFIFIFLVIIFFQRPRRCRPVAQSHIFSSLFLFLSYSGDLYWIGCDKSCSTLIGRHKLGVVQMHVYQPLTQLWRVHLLNPAMQGLTERCRTQIFQLAEQCCTQNFYLRCFKSDTAYPGH